MRGGITSSAVALVAAAAASTVLFSSSSSAVPLTSDGASKNALKHSFTSRVSTSSTSPSSSSPAPASQAAISAVGFDYVSAVQQGVSLAKNSWEYGALAQALLEVYDPSLSVFGTSSTAFPSGKIPKESVSSVKSLSYAKPHISTNTANYALVAGQGATGDPASLGVAAIMIGQTDSSYLTAAGKQSNHLNQVPKYANGAISQRENIAELWADWMYLAPPFLAYYAAQTSDTDLMKEVVTQCTLQRQVLQLTTAAVNATSSNSSSDTFNGQGLWQHIVGPQSQTLGLWSTGNAWAALGMVRVLATILHWPRTSTWASSPTTLKQYIYEIFDGVISASSLSSGATGTTAIDPTNGLLRNYIVGGADGWNDVSFQWFGEAAGTAGLAAAMYRMAVLDPSLASTYVPWADNARKAIAATVEPSGIVSPTVNPYDWFSQQPYTAGSPEGQAFVAMLGAAYIDCLNAKICN
ncbi:hypothetical protein K437DRAFT_270642 [Tilletiaria anomala UBC 951]|uniref:Six-hairpin glycosidase n=1 Tax=Tilletiaria anomala (strain ATCC 24038 / CBS 436.72 / UBC 951) TaxID=1037660 RepID=A0A066V8Z1_TILAU|nr:uncharacterized protein K437DRAFT_270642 [Tilletiaria anomala UBC 951]KDN38212.1 hypothetical protein K437DRAFT_270642 [Tilletiaria anomala UBC 951]